MLVSGRIYTLDLLPPTQDAGSLSPGWHDIFRIGNPQVNLHVWPASCGVDQIYTPTKFNMAPERWWSEDDPFLLGPGLFSEAIYIYIYIHTNILFMIYVYHYTFGSCKCGTFCAFHRFKTLIKRQTSCTCFHKVWEEQCSSHELRIIMCRFMKYLIVSDSLQNEMCWRIFWKVTLRPNQTVNCRVGTFATNRMIT